MRPVLRLIVSWGGTPANTLLLVMVVSLLFGGGAVYLRLQQPWIGVQIRTLPAADGLEVTAVSSLSPAFGKLVAGDVLRAVALPDQLISLGRLLRTEPFSVPSYAAYAQYRQQHTRLFHALQSGDAIGVVLASGKTITLVPQAFTPLQAVPAVFWWLSLGSLVAFLLGGLVWAYKPYTLESACLLLACISFFCFQTIFSVVISRELVIPASFFTTLLPIQATLLNIFTLSLYIILCYYPNRLMTNWAVYPGIGVTVLLSLNFVFQWVEIPFQAFLLQYVPIILLGTWLMQRQWVASKGDPVNRTTVLMLQLSAMLPCWLIMLLYIFPIAFGKAPLISPIVNRMLFLIIFVGWAVGILRFRLFAMEYWWFKSLLWLLGGSLVVVLDILLVGLLGTSAVYGLGLSVLIAGFLYFPLRQWLLGRLLPTEKQTLKDFLPEFSRSLADAVSPDAFEQRWQDSLVQRFNPLHLEKVDVPAGLPSLSDNGLHLHVPSLDAQFCYRLSGKQFAARLFNQADISHAVSLLTIARMAANASNLREQAIMEERRRIMHDLHDSVGAKLLTLTHQLPDAVHRAATKDALATLRDMIRISLQTSPQKLGERLVDWRMEVAERTEAAGVELLWRESGIRGDPLLTTAQVLELTHIIREVVSNALRHGQPKRLGVVVTLQGGVLCIDVINDGRVDSPHTWKQGTGTRSIQGRIRKLDGKASSLIRHLPFPHIVTRLIVPLAAQV